MSAPSNDLAAVRREIDRLRAERAQLLAELSVARTLKHLTAIKVRATDAAALRGKERE